MECVFDSITRTLKSKGSLVLVGFGRFKVTIRKLRTGEAIEIEAKIVPIHGR